MGMWIISGQWEIRGGWWGSSGKGFFVFPIYGCYQSGWVLGIVGVIFWPYEGLVEWKIKTCYGRLKTAREPGFLVILAADKLPNPEATLPQV